MYRLVIFIGVALLLSPISGLPQNDKQSVKLTQDDKDFFEQLFSMGLYDPKGAELTATMREFNQQKLHTYYWKKGTEYYSTSGIGTKVVFKNGPLPVQATLESAIRNRFHSTAEQWGGLGHPMFGYPPCPPDLAYTAWAYRLGKEELAVELLATAKKSHFSRQQTSMARLRNEQPPNLREEFRTDLCWWAFVGMKNSLERWDDELVSQLYDKIQTHFKDEVVQHFPQGSEVLADIARRGKEGTLGKPQIKAVPADYQKWTLTEKTQFLIKELENYSSSFHGDNYCLDELVKLGEDALPALFQCLENDTRLTRSGAEGGIRHIPNRDRFYVREIAYEAVKRILKSIPQASITYDANRTKSELYRLLGAEAKKYWEANKVKPQLTRFYETLCDLHGVHYDRASALNSLLVSKQIRNIRLPDVNNSSLYWPDAPPELRKELAQFQKPTVAEAILLALDHDLQQKAASNQAYDINMNARYLHSYECCYLVALVYLGDRRILPELQQREANASGFHLRLKLAMTLHKLGESKPLAKLATEIAEGREPKEAFAPVDQRSISDTWTIKSLDETAFIQTLMSAQLPETEQALMAFTQPKHPLYPYFASRFTYENLHQNRDFSGHPYCLSFLREVLKDTTPTGSTFHVEKNTLVEQGRNGGSSGTLQGELKDPANRREQAEGRRCDIQMMRMREVVSGLVEFHPLFKDSQDRFDRNLKWINTQTFRRITSYEANQFSESFDGLLPVFPPLTRAANKEDVEAMKAVFFLEREAKPIDLKLPAWMVLKKDIGNSNYVIRRGLILQAEEQQEKKQYGVLYRAGLKTIKEEEVLRIEPYVPEK